MKTLLLKPDSYGIKKATELLKNGKLVAVPTETVYGLAADAMNKTAVKNIFVAKGRPSDNPLIVHTYSFDNVASLVKSIPPKAKALADKFCPGALTIIMEKSELVPYETTGGLDSVAVRIPNNKAVLDLLRYSGLFLAAPSANTSGKPSPTSAEHVLHDLDGKIDAIIDGGICNVGVESTVISLVNDDPLLLRPGKITVEDIEGVIGKIKIHRAITERLQDNKKAISPGMKYKHYAPSARVILVKANKHDYIDFINATIAEKDTDILSVCFEDEAEFIHGNHTVISKKGDYDTMAYNLFALLRDIDQSDINQVYIHSPDTDGVGLAVYNRLIRAAGFEVIEIENGSIK